MILSQHTNKCDSFCAITTFGRKYKYVPSQLKWLGYRFSKKHNTAWGLITLTAYASATRLCGGWVISACVDLAQTRDPVVYLVVVIVDL